VLNRIYRTIEVKERRSMMKTLKLFLALSAVLLLFVSCQTTGSSNVNTKSPEYAEGKALGQQMAKEHRNKIVCSSKSRFQATKGAKKYADEQRAQGKSEDFAAGFYWGYKEVMEVLVTDQCLD
jgi:hypothetical protein